jgi:hypothetical protein
MTFNTHRFIKKQDKNKRENPKKGRAAFPQFQHKKIKIKKGNKKNT